VGEECAASMAHVAMKCRNDPIQWREFLERDRDRATRIAGFVIDDDAGVVRSVDRLGDEGSGRSIPPKEPPTCSRLVLRSPWRHVVRGLRRTGDGQLPQCVPFTKFVEAFYQGDRSIGTGTVDQDSKRRRQWREPRRHVSSGVPLTDPLVGDPDGAAQRRSANLLARAQGAGHITDGQSLLAGWRRPNHNCSAGGWLGPSKYSPIAPAVRQDQVPSYIKINS
jgi:hypothetical protein